MLFCLKLKQNTAKIIFNSSQKKKHLKHIHIKIPLYRFFLHLKIEKMSVGLAYFIEQLERKNEIVKIDTYVNPSLEITEVVDRISKSKNNKALLFTNTKTKFPLLINSLGSYERMCIAFGVNSLDDIAKDIFDLFNKLQTPKKTVLDKLKMLPELKKIGNYMPQEKSGRGICQEVILTNNDINLYDFPILKCWPHDGGPFITLPIIHTQSPITKTRNVGMYRMQVIDKRTTGMHWHKHKVSAKHFNEYKALQKTMPVAVALGGDPIYTYAATAPLPENVDEYLLAGFIRKKSVSLVRCISQPDIWVPNDADIIIEGYIEPLEDLFLEGPFGDHTGFYSLADYYPKFHVTCITHKKNAIYPATIVGIPPQEDAWIGKATERIFLAPIKMTLSPEIIDMNMPIEGVFHNLVIAQIQKDFVGQAAKVMNAMWGAGQMMFNKILVIAGQHTSIDNYYDLLRQNFKHFNPSRDTYIAKGPMDVLDHSCSKFSFGGKVCFDLTQKIEEELDEDFYNEMPQNIAHLDIFPLDKEIRQIYTDLLTQLKLPVLIISLNKTKPNHIQKLHSQICKEALIDGIKMILYVDACVDITDVSTVIWLVANNIDPQRDLMIEKRPSHLQRNQYVSCLGVDGTVKTKALDNFKRDWPNVIVSNDTTINSIDKKWSSLNLGAFISSPSLKYQGLVKGNAAKVEEE